MSTVSNLCCLVCKAWRAIIWFPSLKLIYQLWFINLVMQLVSWCHTSNKVWKWSIWEFIFNGGSERHGIKAIPGLLYLGKFGCLEVQCVLYIEWRTQLIFRQSMPDFKDLYSQRARTHWSSLGQGSCFVLWHLFSAQNSVWHMALSENFCWINCQ